MNLVLGERNYEEIMIRLGGLRPGGNSEGNVRRNAREVCSAATDSVHKLSTCLLTVRPRENFDETGRSQNVPDAQ
jgi:hypothetical protein